MVTYSCKKILINIYNGFNWSVFIAHWYQIAHATVNVGMDVDRDNLMKFFYSVISMIWSCVRGYNWYNSNLFFVRDLLPVPITYCNIMLYILAKRSDDKMINSYLTDVKSELVLINYNYLHLQLKISLITVSVYDLLTFSFPE